MTDARAGTSPGRLVRDFVQVISGKLLSVGSLVVTGIVLAHALGPAEYGRYATGLAIVLLIDGMLGAPFDTAAMRFGALYRDDPARVDRFLSGAFLLKLLLGGVLLLAAIVGGAPLAGWMVGDPGGARLLAISCTAALGLLAMRGTACALQLGLRFDRFAWLDVAQAVSRLLVVLALVYLGTHGAETYLGAYGIVTAMAFFAGLVWIPQPYLRTRWPAAADLRALVEFGSVSTAGAVLGALTARADVLFLAARSPAAEVGHYGAAAQLAMALTLLASFMGVVLQPRVIPLAQTGGLPRVLGWNVLLAVALGGPLLAIGIWAAPVLVPVLFGTGFADTVPIFRVLLLGTFLDFLSLPVLLHVILQLFPRVVLAVELCVTAVFLVAAPIAAGRWGAVGMSVLVGLTRLVKLVVYGTITLGRLRNAPAHQMRPLAA